jgi:spore protease
MVVDAATMANDTIDMVIDSLINKSPKDSEFYQILKNLDRDEKHKMIQNVLAPTLGNLIVTPKEVDDIIDDISEIIANGINMALHPSIGMDDINLYS